MSKEKALTVGELQLLLNEKYQFRYNEVLGKVELYEAQSKSWVELTELRFNSLLVKFNKDAELVSRPSLRNVLHSDFIPVYNPFREYFENLPEWKGNMDYIDLLAQTIKVSDAERDNLKLYLRRWLIGAVACAINDELQNQTVLTLIGKQGIGKTKWLDKLVPEILSKYYYSGTINPNNKDTKINLSECFIINLDELENLNRGELGTLKQTITEASIRIRRPYGERAETIPRRASFVGSVNNVEFLKDNTGNRRFLCIEALEISYLHPIDINKVFAQAYSLYKAGERYWFNHDENAMINEANEKYRASFVELEYVRQHFIPCPENEKPDVLYSTTQLQDFLLQPKHRNKIQNLNLRKLGMAMHNSSFDRTKKDGIWFWRLKRIKS